MKYFFITSAFIGNTISLFINFPKYLKNKLCQNTGRLFISAVVSLFLYSIYYLYLGYTSNRIFYVFSLAFLLFFILYLGIYLDFKKSNPHFILKRYINDKSIFYSEPIKLFQSEFDESILIDNTINFNTFFKEKDMLIEIEELLIKNNFYPKKRRLTPIEMNTLLLKIEKLNLFKYDINQSKMLNSARNHYKVSKKGSYSRLKTKYERNEFTDIDNERFDKLDFLNEISINNKVNKSILT